MKTALFDAPKVSLLDEPKIPLRDVARRLDMHPKTPERWAKHGVGGRKLPTVRIGGRLFVLLSDLEAFLTAGRDATTRQSEADAAFEQQAAHDQKVVAALLNPSRA